MMALVDIFNDDAEEKQYHESSDIVEIGVYAKKSILEHKIDLVQRMEKAQNICKEPIDDNGLTYWGVFWTIPFNKFKKSLEEYITWRDGITKFDGASQRMVFGYDGHLKKIWFASNGHWQGYFEIDSIEGNDVFLCKWHPLKDPSKHLRSAFRGYTIKVPKVVNN